MVDLPIKVLLCGDVNAIEMQSIEASIDRFAPNSQVNQFEQLSDAVTALTETGWCPGLVVVAQQRPEQFAPADIKQLQKLLPLARWVCCCGLWCESDGHNGSLWPEAVRIFARTADVRLRQEFAILRGERIPLPLTAARDEIFISDSTGAWSRCGVDLPIDVRGPDRELLRTIEDLLTSAGYRIARQEFETSGSAVVWDVDPWRDEIALEVRSFCAQNPNIPVIAMMNFASPQLVFAVKLCGVASVVAKLTSAAELINALEAALDSSTTEPFGKS